MSLRRADPQGGNRWLAGVESKMALVHHLEGRQTEGLKLELEILKPLERVDTKTDLGAQTGRGSEVGNLREVLAVVGGGSGGVTGQGGQKTVEVGVARLGGELAGRHAKIRADDGVKPSGRVNLRFGLHFGGRAAGMINKPNLYEAARGHLAYRNPPTKTKNIHSDDSRSFTAT